MYMELKTTPLPSGKGKFAYPLYVYLVPIRGHNISYHPDIQYTGDLKNTGELQRFFLNQTEQVK